MESRFCRNVDTSRYSRVAVLSYRKEEKSISRPDGSIVDYVLCKETAPDGRVHRIIIGDDYVKQLPESERGRKRDNDFDQDRQNCPTLFIWIPGGDIEDIRRVLLKELSILRLAAEVGVLVWAFNVRPENVVTAFTSAWNGMMELSVEVTRYCVRRGPGFTLRLVYGEVLYGGRPCDYVVHSRLVSLNNIIRAANRLLHDHKSVRTWLFTTRPCSDANDPMLINADDKIIAPDWAMFKKGSSHVPAAHVYAGIASYFRYVLKQKSMVFSGPTDKFMYSTGKLVDSEKWAGDKLLIKLMGVQRKLWPQLDMETIEVKPRITNQEEKADTEEELDMVDVNAILDQVDEVELIDLQEPLIDLYKQL